MKFDSDCGVTAPRSRFNDNERNAVRTECPISPKQPKSKYTGHTNSTNARHSTNSTARTFFNFSIEHVTNCNHGLYVLLSGHQFAKRICSTSTSAPNNAEVCDDAGVAGDGSYNDRSAVEPCRYHAAPSIDACHQ